eukprot:GHVN01056752.1.p1 GENE.GHVN01056752.1~~GHVN01056752.1.p1  ORF type:complete len:103 (-),score=16.89 GHVN01056752.1:145-453(-)
MRFPEEGEEVKYKEQVSHFMTSVGSGDSSDIGRIIAASLQRRETSGVKVDKLLSCAGEDPDEWFLSFERACLKKGAKRKWWKKGTLQQHGRECIVASRASGG